MNRPTRPLLAAVLALLAFACTADPGSAGDPPATTEAPVAVSTTSTTTTGPSTTLAAPVSLDGDTQDGRERAFLDGLVAINPALTVNEERSLGRAENTCADIAAGKDEATVLANTVARFDGAVSVDGVLGAQILGLIRTHLCPS